MAGLDAILSQQSQNTGDQIGVNDVLNDAYYVPQEHIPAFQEFQQQNNYVSPGALPQSAYYPGLGQPIAVGNSSGSVIGSQTLFAPGGGLIPLGMMDARDQAVQKAALAKAKAADDFLTSLQKQKPVSKLTNINDKLYQDYIMHVDDSWKSALKKTNGDPFAAKKLLQSDPAFMAKTQSYFNLASKGNYVFDKLAEFEKDQKDGRILAPSMIETMNRIKTAIDPSHPDFSKLTTLLSQYRTDAEFNKTAGDVMKNLVESKTGKSYDLSNPEQVKIFNRDIAELSDDAKSAGLNDLNTIYGNSSIYSKEYIADQWKKMTSYQKVNESMNISQKREDTTPIMEVPDPNKEGDEINISVMSAIDPSTGKQGAARQSSTKIYDQITLGGTQKPVKVQIPISSQSFDPKTGDKIKEQGNVEATIGSIANVPVIDLPKNNPNSVLNGVVIDKDNAPKLSKNTKYVTSVNVTYTTKDASGNDVTVSEWRPLETVENALVGTKGQNKKAIAEMKARAEQRTQQLRGTTTPSKKSTPEKKNDPLGLF